MANRSIQKKLGHPKSQRSIKSHDSFKLKTALQYQMADPKPGCQTNPNARTTPIAQQPFAQWIIKLTRLQQSFHNPLTSAPCWSNNLRSGSSISLANNTCRIPRRLCTRGNLIDHSNLAVDCKQCSFEANQIWPKTHLPNPNADLRTARVN